MSNDKIDMNPPQHKVPEVTAYFSASIRGREGSKASQDTINRNIEMGKKVAGKMQRFFGTLLNMYVPHNQDELIQILWHSKKINVWDILKGDCEIVAARDLLFVFAEDGFLSTGMIREMDEAKKTNIPTLVFEHFDMETAKKMLTMITKIALPFEMRE